jgi:hypothetical protein
MATRFNTMRNPKYLEFIRTRPCWFCGRPAEPHHSIRHWRPISDGGLGRKGSDYLAIPLCRQCHEEVHSGHLKIERAALLEIIVINLVVFIAELEHRRRR